MVCKRMIHSITAKAQAMMIDSQAPAQFLGETVNTAVYLLQSSPNKSLIGTDRCGYQLL